jgi:uncharacterized protein YggE
MKDDRLVVHGSAQRFVAPDVATLRLVVREIDPDQRAAFERCRPRINEAVARLQAVVGGDGEITTGTLSVEPFWEPSTEQEREQRVQEVTGPIAVECTAALAERVVAEAMALGPDQLHGPRYSVRDPSPVLDELLGEAVAAARRKAQRLAQAAERSLGRVVAVEERWRDGWDGDGFRTLSAGAASSEIDLRPAEMVLTATVRVTFALE